MLELDLIRLMRHGRLVLDEVISAEDPCWLDSGLRPGAETRVQLVVRQVGLDVLVRGEVTSLLQGECRRCLGPVSSPVRERVTWLFRAGIEAVEAELHEVFVLPANTSRLALGGALLEQLVVAAPAFFLCAEGCRGLCQGCGARLDEGGCSCDRVVESGDSRWEVLRRLAGGSGS